MPSGGNSSSGSNSSNNTSSTTRSSSSHIDDSIEYTIDEFEFRKQLLEYGYYIALGRRRSGKTTYLRQISQHLKKGKTAQHLVITGNEKIKELWGEIVHPIYIHDPSIEILKRIIREQNRRIKECKMLGVPFPKEWEVILWIDDCGTLKWFMHSQEMKWLSSNGRNINIEIYVLVQKLTQPCTESRENADGVLTLQTQHYKTLKLLHDEYASAIKMNLFQAMVAGATRERGMLVLNAHPEKPIPRDMFFFSHCDILHEDGYEGKLEPVGSDMHWEFAKANYKAQISSAPLSSVVEQTKTKEELLQLQSDSDDENQTDEDDTKIRFTGLPYTQGPFTIKFNCKSSSSRKKLNGSITAG